MEPVLARIQRGIIPSLFDGEGHLDAQAVSEEFIGLQEDILNFENGLPMTACDGTAEPLTQ